MRFADYFANVGRKPVYSFEVFPPKTDKAYANLKEILPELIELKPAYMTVTYGAMGTTQERTLEIAALIKRQFKLETASHLTCVGSSRAQLDAILENLQRNEIHNIVALRGDPPKGEESFTPPPDGLAHANELVAHIRGWCERTGNPRFGIAVAGYPEKHLEAPDAAADLRNLKRKVETGAEAVITQLFYDNADYFRFVEAARGAGIAQPIVPGLMPIQSGKQIQRITSMCGSKIPAPLLKDLQAAGDDDARCTEIGIAWCAAQARELVAGGAPGIHFYVLNKAAHMREIMRQL
ncbi:MAG: methylenetetrahydrofolate reductase [NAD(P)H] [Planctomycetota bacterium]|nr:methylenetetrahydrofolate reductase [NAD(P)H] [Planctomycetota bacterium]